MRTLFATSNDPVLTWLRLMLGIVFFPHGAQKMLGWFGGHGFSATMGGMEKVGIPAFFVFLAICAEFFGSLGLISGLLTRVAAFGIGVNMVVAILMVHARNGFFMNWAGNQRGEGFEYHLLALAIAAALVIRGGGAASIDRLIWSAGEKTRAVGPRLAKTA
jgi:putative oxidoreductase